MPELKAGLIGANIQKTRLPFALEALCALHDIAFSFDLIDTALIDGFDFDACVDERMARGWTGVTVTHPYKPAAAAYAGTLIGAPAHIGASNTLIFGQSRSRTDVLAYNTDYTGFIAAWQAQLGGRKPGVVAMAGAGGVSRAIAVALIEMGADELAIWDLDLSRAEDVARLADPSGVRAFAVPIEDAGPYVEKAEGLVNATALGMAQYPGMAFEAAQIGAQQWAFDAVYTPTWTAFMKKAQMSGLHCFTGFSLFKYMAVRSFKAYTGHTIDPVDVDRLIDPLAEAVK